MKTWHVILAVGVLASAWVSAREADSRGAEMEQLFEEEERLEQQMAADDDGEAEMLEMQLDQVRNRLEELEREQGFREIQRQQLEHAWEIDMEIAQIRRELAEEEGEMDQVHRDLAEGRVSQLKKLGDLARQVAALQGPDQLPEAFELLGHIELAEMRWDMVDAPRLESAARLREMEEAAAEFGNPPELLVGIAKAKELRETIIADAEDLFQRLRKHRQQRRELDETLDGFWQKLEEAHAGPERLP